MKARLDIPRNSMPATCMFSQAQKRVIILARSSSRELRTRVPLFSVACFSRGNLHKKKVEGHYWGTQLVLTHKTTVRVGFHASKKYVSRKTLLDHQFRLPAFGIHMEPEKRADPVLRRSAVVCKWPLAGTEFKATMRDEGFAGVQALSTLQRGS